MCSLCRLAAPLTYQKLRPKVYFVKVDIQRCYDTIKQDKLMDLIRYVLSEVRHNKSSTY
jgi:hypothetical protein